MDSTISVQPGERQIHYIGPGDGLVVCRRSGRLVRFSSLALPPRWCSTANFPTQIGPAMGTLAAFATFGVGFLFRPLGGVFWPLRRSPRAKRMLMTVWMMGIATACIRPAPLVQPDRLVGAGAAGVPASGSGIRIHGGEWGSAALLSVECPTGKKAFTAAGCR